MITIYFDQQRINKQVLRPNEKFFFNKEGRLRTEYDILKDAKAIAHDISSGTYYNVEVQLN